ncbi:DNA circularization N-terminal domain-containing protein [Methylomonas sp. HW2-6]|uniref:DNA circularization N-terminal domain-containing protein n=1 Tax=Methylomonas sp. HW2-6 TaxID=3376687 RepID=UPI004042A7EE
MAEQSYLDRWAPAQWRDIEFLTDRHDDKGGRRLVVHEFPGAEEPLVEDLGGKAWDYQLNAYFLGNDYDLEVDALIAELNKPGADWLVHPWLGRLWLRPQTWSRQESSDANGYCTLTIGWAPGGGAPQVPRPDAADLAMASLAEWASSAEDDFDLLAMGEDALAAFSSITQSGMEMVRQAISLSALPLSFAQKVMTGALGFQHDIATLAAVPRSYSNALRGLLGGIGLGADDVGLAPGSRVRLVSRLAGLAVASASPTFITPAGVSLIDTTARTNIVAAAELQSRLLFGAAMQTALADFTTELDRDMAVLAIDTAYDALLPALPDTLFQAAVSARAAVVKAVMAQDLKPQQIRDIVSPLPSTVLAHRMQIDEAVFLERNAVRHPLFVQGRMYG